MDLVAGCRVLVQLADRGSVSDAAAALGIPQPVASRRLGALERRLGIPLVDRSARSSAVGERARELLPTVRRLVELADAVELDAGRMRSRPLTLAVPLASPLRALADLTAEAARAGRPLETRGAEPAERRSLVEAGLVRAALVPVPTDRATWAAPLGVAVARGEAADQAAGQTTGDAAAGEAASDGGVRLEQLRPSRARPAALRLAGRALVLTPEDDVPHVRGAVERAAAAHGLLARQVRIAASTSGAVAAALTGDAALLTALEAHAAGLAFAPLIDPVVVRGHAVAASDPADAAVVVGALARSVAVSLGAAS